MLLDNLHEIARRAPASSGLRASAVFHSYSQLAERAEGLGAGLADRGIAVGEAVGILLPNGPELFAVAYGLFGIGAIAVPLSIHAPAPELAAACRRARVRALVVREDHAALAERIDASLPVFVSGGTTINSLDVLARTQPGRRRNPPGDAAALYLFSSGSTGQPKVVPHTHAEMLANGRATALDFALGGDDVVFNNLPGNHAMGFLNSVFEVPQAGASTFYFSDPAPLLLARGRLLESLAAERVTVLPGVPFMFDALAGTSGEDHLSSVRLTYSAGIRLKRAIFDRFRERYGLTIRQAYGCTEAGHVAFNRAEDPDLTWDSVGQPVGDTIVEVIPSENALGDEVGELAFHSSSLTKGYLGQERLNATVFADGRFVTGDLGRIDDAGNVYIKGRSKLIVEVSGHKVDPLEIEEVVSHHPAVSEVVVVGVPEPRTGEQRLRMFVVRAGEATQAELIAFCRERLSPQKVPASVEFIDAIPKSASGKVLRGKLMEA
ncbi:MAG: class I adenylate-forming enzyme family protein [Devosia sp.]